MAAPIVEIKQGKLRGCQRDNIDDGGKYFSFRGVPYAEPPVGDLRFKEPQPLKPWAGIRDALNESKMSAQYDLGSKLKEGGDDCLYVDIATNSLTVKSPVMVWIHGGAFKRSSNTYKKYSPDYLLTKDIVYVGVNYRLGLLGFLNMEHEECPGNQGLQDQIAALRWVQENIEAFGGDPSNVTIFGESAGGASVHALCLASKAKGLFHKAITQSGVISNPWTHVISNKEQGYALAKAFGQNSTDPLEVIKFLRTIPAQELVATQENLNKRESLSLNLTLVPSPDFKSSDPVFAQPLTEWGKNGIEVPLLIGYNSEEGIIMFLADQVALMTELEKNFEKVIGRYLKIKDDKKISEVSKVIREFYFGKDGVSVKKIDEAVQFFGDMLFAMGILEVADKQMNKTTPTYLYKFSYRPNFPGMKERFGVKIEGTCHADELGCLFFSEARRSRLPEGSRDRLTMERMTTMWTNFAKFGDPTPVVDKLITTKWKPLEKSEKYYLEINDNLTSGINPDEQAWQMWKSVYETIK